MGKYIEARTLYNLLNQVVFNAYLSDPYFILLVDVRKPEQYNEAHIRHAINLKMNSENKFQLPFGIGLEWKWNIIVYDQDTFNLPIDSHVAAARNFLMNNGAFCAVRVLRGGYRYFTKLYPFMSTQKIFYLPREIECEITYPLEVIPDFIYLSVKKNSETEEALKDLRISAKVFLYSEETVRADEAMKLHFAFPLETSRDHDMFNYLNDCCEFLKMNKNRVHRVLIVADKYLSRGPTLAMAYLIKEENMTLKEAWRYMKCVYLALRPNWHCLEQLALFEKTVKNLPEATPIVDEEFQ